jgi:hypothetical protein
VGRWSWIPESCASVGCIRASISPSGANGVLEIEREAPLPESAQFVLACAEPAPEPPSATLVQLVTAGQLPLPLQRIVLRLNRTAPARLTTAVPFASRLWFAPDGSGCRNLEVLDASALPGNESILGEATAHASP